MSKVNKNNSNRIFGKKSEIILKMNSKWIDRDEKFFNNYSLKIISQQHKNEYDKKSSSNELNSKENKIISWNWEVIDKRNEIISKELKKVFN